MKRPADIAVTIACVAGAIASYAAYARDNATRVAPAQFARRYTMDVRRPDVVMSLALAPSGDFASDLVADATLQDAVVPVNLKNVTPAVRQAWLDSVGRVDEQMDGASALMLDAMAARPGWPYHPALLGRLVYTRDARALSPSLVTQPERWSKPMDSAAVAASGDQGLWESLALAYIQTWPDLANRHAADANRVLTKAFEDNVFVEHAFAPACSIIGTSRAVQFLPDRSAPLRIAFGELAKQRDVTSAWTVHRRWEAAEWRERTRDAEVIRNMVARGDLDAAQQFCERWGRDHDPLSFDDAAGRRQVASILEMWPNRAPREWDSEPRSAMVRFFLDGRTQFVSSATLARSIASLTNVPAEIRAEIAARNQQFDDAERIASASQDEGSRSWMPYYLASAETALKRNDPRRAAAFLARLRGALRDECAARAMALAIARAQRDPGEAAAIERGLSGRNAVDATSGNGSAPVCLSDEGPAFMTLRFQDRSTAHVVDYGSDGGRLRSAIFPASVEVVRLAVTVPGGSHMLNWQVVAPAQ